MIAHARCFVAMLLLRAQRGTLAVMAEENAREATPDLYCTSGLEPPMKAAACPPAKATLHIRRAKHMGNDCATPPALDICKKPSASRKNEAAPGAFFVRLPTVPLRTGGLDMPATRNNPRHAKRVKRNFTLDEDADVLLRHYCHPGQKAHGRFLSRLIYEFHSRRQEWEKMVAARDGSRGDVATHALQDAPAN